MRKIILILLIGVALTGKATKHYVSAVATSSGTGTFTNPWKFQTALNHPTTLLPGDTVLIRGGIYTNAFDPNTSFSCKTNGTANAPIIFRNYQNEKATLDGNLVYTLYCGLGTCSYTWFWGLEVTNSYSTSRKVTTKGGVTCTAENMKFINMIVHDTGGGIDSWKTAKNAETYGCIIYHIGNNVLNGTNWEGHGHGMYLQNDTIGITKIHNNIVFSTFGYGIKVWQTTTTAAIGNFDIRKNIVFNGGAASENLGGVGNNFRTHNFFVVSNGSNNPVRNTTIKRNYTYAGINMPRPTVNAFGLNHGVKNFTLDSNYLTCQTRLGYNNTPIFQASVKENKIIGGIPSVYGTYLWGFVQADYPQNTYVPTVPTTGLDYFVMPNKYEPGRANIAVYNWAGLSTVTINVSNIGLNTGDQYQLINVMDYYNNIITGTYNSTGNITVPMTGHTCAAVVGSTQVPVSQFPNFGAFVIRKTSSSIPTSIDAELANNLQVTIAPNPFNDVCEIKINGNQDKHYTVDLYNAIGQKVLTQNFENNKVTLHRKELSEGIYFYSIMNENNFKIANGRVVIQ